MAPLSETFLYMVCNVKDNHMNMCACMYMLEKKRILVILSGE